MKGLLLAIVLLLSHPTASGADWRSTGESTFSFSTTFEGEPIGGEFGRFDVRFSFDPANPGDAILIVTVELTAADMGDDDMNAVLFDPAWFNTAEFDTAVFESRTIVERGQGEYAASGTLRLKGIKGPVTVPFTWAQGNNSARMQGALTLNRTDFGVGTGEWSSGESVGLRTELEFDVVLEPAD